MDNQNNMFINNGMASTDSNANNGSINESLNAVFPNQMATNNSNMSGVSTGGDTLSFSMPGVNDNISNSIDNVGSQNNNDGSFTFVNPNITGAIQNSDGTVNSVSSFGIQDNVSSVINNGLGNNVVSNDSVGSLGFMLENSNDLSGQNNNLVNDGMSLDNNVLLNRNNSMMNENVSNNLVSSIPIEGIATNNINDNSEERIISVKKYLGHILLFSIPLVGFVMLFVKAFGKNDDKNISNFAKAQLILSVIFGGVFIVLFILVMIFGVALY